MAAPGPGGAEAAGGRRRRPPLSALSAFSSVPAGRAAPPELRYFQREAEEMFPLTMPFLKDQRVTTKIFTDVTENMRRVVVLTLMRSTTLKAVELNPPQYTDFLEVAKAKPLQERARPVAVLSSSEYGRHINKPIEELIRDHARINHVQAEFYRKNGITCLLEKPSPSLDPC